MKTSGVSQEELEVKAREIGGLIGGALPPTVGFALLVFTFGEGGYLAWISNAQRSDMMLALTEFMSKQGH